MVVIYQMPCDIWVDSTAHLRTTASAEIYIETEFGLKDCDWYVPSDEGHYPYEVIDEKKFALFLLRWE